jgi:hypothetical protein
MINSEALITKFPQDKETVKRLINIIADEKGSAQQREFPLKRLFDRTSPRSEIALAQILSYLVNIGDLQLIFRVESPNNGGLADFSSLMDIPEIVHDWRRDIDMCVTLDDISVLYKVISDLDNSSL